MSFSSSFYGSGEAKPNPRPVNVFEAPLPIICPGQYRTELLPYLALGFTPVWTSGNGDLCAVHALAAGLKATKEILDIPPGPNGHVSFDGLRKTLQSPAWKQKATEHIDKSNPILFHTNQEMRRMQIAELSERSNLDITQIHMLLEIVNKAENSNFSLGVITRGYLTKKRIVATNVTILQDETGTQPVIWLYNDNSSEAFSNRHREDILEAQERGESETIIKQMRRNNPRVLSHWEALAIPPADLQEATRRRLVQGWNFGPDILRDVTTGIWRTTAGNIGQSLPVNGLKYDRGQFLRETSPPPGTDVPQGFKYMISPASAVQGNLEEIRRRGLVLDSDLVRIELHPNVPTTASDSTPFEPVVEGRFRIYRGVTPAAKFGNPSSSAERLVRDGFFIQAGEFLFDLQRHDGIWTRVRKVEGREGWAHPRFLEQLNSPWDLPEEVSCMPSGRPAAGAHTVNDPRSLLEANKWGYANDMDTETPLNYLNRFDRADHALPFGLMTKAHTSGQVKFAERELVLKAGIIPEAYATEIVNYKGERAVVDSDSISPVRSIWGLAITAEKLEQALSFVSTMKAIKLMESGLGNNVADMQIHSSPVVGSGGKHLSDDKGNTVGPGPKKQKTNGIGQMGLQQSGDLSQQERDRQARLKAALKRRDLQKKKK